MPLTSAQLESVREMVGDKTYATVESLAEEMNAAQEAAMIEDVDEWERVKFKGISLEGGKDGIDLDFDRNRRMLRDRVRRRLGLSGLPIGGLFRIGVGSDYASSCDLLGNA